MSDSSFRSRAQNARPAEKSMTPGTGQDVETLRSLLTAAERRAAMLAELTSLMSEGRDPLELAQRCVELTARATRASGTFIYLWNADEERLVLRVATEGWRRSVLGRIRLRLGEGITGWSALMRQTVVVPSDPLSDPRAIKFPELREELFQSMVAVPILEPGGDVLGVFVLYALHKHAFSPADVNLASEVGALLASGFVQAVTIARLRTQSSIARFLADLPGDAYGSLDRCLRTVADGIAHHLETDVCLVELNEHFSADGIGKTELVVDSEYAEQQPQGQFADIAPSEWGERARRGELHRLRLPLGSTHPVGALTCYRRRRFTEQDSELAEVIGAQAAAALLSVVGREVVAPLIDRLLDPSDGEPVAGLLSALGWSPGPTRIFVVHTRRSGDANHAKKMRSDLCELTEDYPGSVVVSGLHDDLIVFAGSSPKRSPDMELRRRLARAREVPGIEMTAGVGPTVREAATLKLSIRHALTAARWAELAGGNGTLVEYEKIAHLQLLPSIVLSMSGDLRRVVGALDGLVAYDLEHGTDLAKTLNCFVTNRGSIARTASQLYIHRNTLRQRLRRIDELTGQPPESFENWLTAGLAARIIERSEDELASAPSDREAWCPRSVMTVGSFCCDLPSHCALTIKPDPGH